MTEQEIFKTVWHFMKAQGKQSIDATGGCFYRSPEGGKCAVGCLISDADFNPEMEGLNVDELMERELLPDNLAAHKGILFRLQVAHDAANPADFWHDFSDSARAVAVSYSLTVPGNDQ